MKSKRRYPTVTGYVVERVEGQYGKRALDILGTNLYEQALNSALLVHLSLQGESVDPALLVRILNEVRSDIIDIVNETEPAR